jgi:hypothetical protein
MTAPNEPLKGRTVPSYSSKILIEATKGAGKGNSYEIKVDTKSFDMDNWTGSTTAPGPREAKLTAPINGQLLQALLGV